MVGDIVLSEDGEYLMPDGSTIVVLEGVITEIRPAVEEAEETTEERGEETQEELRQDETDSEKDAEIDRLKAEIAEKDAEIDRLRRELEDATANAKSNSDKMVLNMVEMDGGIDWLKTVKSSVTIEKRNTETTNLDKTHAKAERMGFTEYYNKRKEKKNK